MGTLSSLVSRFTSNTKGGRGATTGGTTGRAGGTNSQDAKIGRAVRTAVKKFTGKR